MKPPKPNSPSEKGDAAELTNDDIVELLMVMRQSDLRVISFIEKKLGLNREIKCPHCGKRHKESA